jgi:hypothetical protein
MSVYNIKQLKDGVNSQGILNATPGERNLYNEGYHLEIQHVPTGYKVKFPAYLDNFSDAYTQSWNAEDVYGRMDPIAVYQNTRRAIAMSWHVPANSFSQAKDNMDIINTLMTFMYPSYSKQGKTDNAGGVLNMAPLVRVKFVNLVHNAADPNLGLLGYLGGFTVDVRSEDGMFMNQSQQGPAAYPKTVTLNMELNVLHEHSMGWTSGKSGDRVLRQAKNGFPYRTDMAVPSTDNPPTPPPPKPPANQKSSTPPAGGGAANVLAGPGSSGIVKPGQV